MVISVVITNKLMFVCTKDKDYYTKTTNIIFVTGKNTGNSLSHTIRKYN